jgi:site-specific DNA-methyltransferase (adenine-specific)
MIKPYFQSDDGYFTLYHGDCFEVIKILDKSSVDMLFADPPYFLSSGGSTCKNGKRVSVNKGKWDKSVEIKDIHKFNKRWIRLCKRTLKKCATLWISGTYHNIYSIGLALQELEFKILNNIVWQKPNPPPNLSCRYFTHSTETILWARPGKKHCFNYKEMRKINNNKQMKDVWNFTSPLKKEKLSGKHPTQKPLALLERIILASTSVGNLVCDPFSGSGTTGIAAYRLSRKYIGIEKNKKYLDLTIKRFLSEFKNE